MQAFEIPIPLRQPNNKIFADYLNFFLGFKEVWNIETMRTDFFYDLIYKW